MRTRHARQIRVGILYANMRGPAPVHIGNLAWKAYMRRRQQLPAPPHEPGPLARLAIEVNSLRADVTALQDAIQPKETP